MSAMTDLKRRLYEKSTQELQDSIRHRHLTEEASSLACEILGERGAPIPEPIPEEVLEEGYKNQLRNSNRNFLSTVFVLGAWFVYGYQTGLFELGNQERLNQSMLVTFLLIAAIWGWDLLGKRK